MESSVLDIWTMDKHTSAPVSYFGADIMDKIPTELDPSGSILFLGAGFSKGALNIQGTELPLGIDLRNKFAKMLNVDPNSYLITLESKQHLV